MKPILSLVLMAAIAAAGPAHAQFAKAEDAVKYRKSALFVMQQNFARVAGMAGGKIPFDAKVAADSAAVAEYVSRLPWTAFGEGTDKGDTRAKPEIWKERAKFDEYADKMQAEMVKLVRCCQNRQPRQHQSRRQRHRRQLQNLPRRLPQGIDSSGQFVRSNSPGKR